MPAPAPASEEFSVNTLSVEKVSVEKLLQSLKQGIYREESQNPRLSLRETSQLHLFLLEVEK